MLANFSMWTFCNTEIVVQNLFTEFEYKFIRLINKHHKFVFGEMTLKFSHNIFVTFVEKTKLMWEMDVCLSKSNLRLKNKNKTNKLEKATSSGVLAFSE